MPSSPFSVNEVVASQSSLSPDGLSLLALESAIDLSSSPSPDNIWAYLPLELGSLASLHRLDLHTNRLYGSIPSSLSNASTLHGDNLSGNLPLDLQSPPSTSRATPHPAPSQTLSPIPASSSASLWPKTNFLARIQTRYGQSQVV
ncbi:hypothetical protein MRB53_014811 [Persea americana]|uniref:Uncharacterized protein n=1 Tax=Persea americana TaxID=3435 RepID=A0ACC2KCF1_PERAE|nr:hypothetical protein MRB53_014811 [Persea americana]